METGLLTKEIKKTLEDIVGYCFYSNRILDRICSILSVSFVMPVTSDLIHHKLAHKYPLLADDISGYMDARDCTTIYGETPRGDQDYESPLDCFNKMLEINLKLERYIKEAIETSHKDSDYTTKVFLENFLLKIIPITKDILLLIDKMEMYGDSDISIMKFDHDIKDFGVFEY